MTREELLELQKNRYEPISNAQIDSIIDMAAWAFYARDALRFYRDCSHTIKVKSGQDMSEETIVHEKGQEALEALAKLPEVFRG